MSEKMGNMERVAFPKVSVIITCYNHARFLAEAIESARRQTYPSVEIIVVNDGSTDGSREVAAAFTDVQYVYQTNAGLSAARNKGIEKSTGSYLVFLDADDYLYPDAVLANLKYLRKHPECAFVSGWHDKVDEWLYPLEEQDELRVIESKHYQHLLRGNYIGMHATVMYQRWAFDSIRFDTSLRACEDYDVYFKMAARYPVGCHAQRIAAYRIHGANMSSNILMMYNHVLKVCFRQWPMLESAEDRNAYRAGLRIWKGYYSARLFHLLWNDLEKSTTWPPSDQLFILATERPVKFLAFVTKKLRFLFRTALKKFLPDTALKVLSQKGYFKNYLPPVGKVDAGDFHRLTPFSNDFGFDRGGAIDRFYIENFIEENSPVVKGAVLEIGDNEYTMKYGRDLVQQSDILHIDSSNNKATYVGDITNIPEIPSEKFDCIIFTQTLHLIYDFKSALHTCYRLLKPGGCLLLTVPGITPVDRGPWKDYWLWSFTDTAMKKVMTETFNGSVVEVKTYGNVYVASAFLYGMGLSEFKEDVLKHHDPSYQVIISVKAIKH
jgi:glycosyltransferase involved in cell wall biosynthesis